MKQFTNNLPDSQKWLGTDFQKELNSAVDNKEKYFSTPDGTEYEIIDKGSVKNSTGIISRKIEMQVDNKRSLLGLEVLKFNQEVTAENVQSLYDQQTKTKFLVIDDLENPYVLKFNWIETDSIKSLDPDFLPEHDAFELSESIQNFLRENNFPVIKSKFPEEYTSGPIEKEAKETPKDTNE